jgi:hypothetical protein
MMVLRKAETLVYQGTEPPTLKLLAEAILSVRARAPLGQDQTITAHVRSASRDQRNATRKI